MNLERCSNRMEVWRQLMLVAGIGCFVAATASQSWAQVPAVPPVPDQSVDAETDVDASAEAATDAGANAATDAQEDAENATNAETQADATAEAATDAAPDAEANIRTQTNQEADVDAQAPTRQRDAGEANADAQAPTRQPDAGVDADANIRDRRGQATDAQAGFDAQTRLGAGVSMQNGRLILGNVASQSLAARAGLRTSDEIVSINGTQVRTREAYDMALRDVIGPATIQYRRGGQLYTARVELPPAAPQREERFFRGADAVQSGDAAQKQGSPVQKGGYANGPVQNGYYANGGCGHHHHRHHRRRFR